PAAMRRREFITLIGGAAAWPLAARAQHGERMRRIGVIMAGAADDPALQLRLTALMQGVQELGWSVGRNLRIDYRWNSTNNNYSRIRKHVSEILALAPDLIITPAGTIVDAIQQETDNVPIVFIGIIDAVGTARVESLARPGANATGFTGAEYSIAGKLLEVLEELAPAVTRAAVIRELRSVGGSGQFGAIQAVAPRLGVELTSVDTSSPAAIERGITAFARGR